MKIKVGGRYVARNGKVVLITGLSRNAQWPFVGDDYRTYTESGSFIGDTPQVHDLIYEFKDEGARSKLPTILTGLFWLSVIIGVIGFWGIAAVKLWQMIPGN